MSTIAQSRDLSDPQTIETFADVVQTLERLKLLLVLTDRRHQGGRPGVWTGWKGQLLRTLYYETEVVLAGGHSELARIGAGAPGAGGAARRAARLDATRSSTPMPRATTRPIGSRSSPAGAAQARALRPRRARRPGGRSRPRSRPTPSAASPSSPCSSPDHPRLLAIITGACAAARRQHRRRADLHHRPTAWRSTPSSSRAPSSCDDGRAAPSRARRDRDRAGAQGRGQDRRSRRRPARRRASGAQDLPRACPRSSSTTRCRTARP